MIFPSSDKNCDKVSPNAPAILSKEAKEGNIFFRYHDEIVDCGNSERLANSYSVQFRSFRYCVIRCNISIILVPISRF